MSNQGINTVGVQFRRAGKIYDFSANGHQVLVGDFVIVDSERGPSLAEVVAINFRHPNDKFEKKLKPIVRIASPKEMARPSRLSSEEVNRFTSEQVKKHKLKMRILKCEVQFGSNKIVVYFTSPGRVDFRELVKDLASGLKARIELKQIGARDEAKLLGGIGICGREYCCSSFLREFVPVSIRMAKNQNLALNPHKVSGGCGRLLCCLTYENSTYSSLRQLLPARGTRVKIVPEEFIGVVQRVDLLNQIVEIKGEDGREEVAKVNQIEVLERNQGKVEEQESLDPAATEWADNLDLDALETEISKLDDQAQDQESKKGQHSQWKKARPHSNQQQKSERKHLPRKGKPGSQGHNPGAKNREGRSSEGGVQMAGSPANEGEATNGRRQHNHQARRGKRDGRQSEGLGADQNEIKTHRPKQRFRGRQKPKKPEN